VSATPASTGRRTLYLVFGILLMLGGLFGVTLTLAAATMTDIGPYGTAAFAVCTAGFVAPAVGLFYIYWRASARAKLYQEVGAILRSVRDVSVRDVAVKIGKTPAETELLIARTVAEGYAQGYVDPQKGMFVATAWGGFAPGQTPQIIVNAPPIAQPFYIPQPIYAPPAPLQVQVIREIVKVPCRYCGALVETTAIRCPGCSAPVQ